jgi:hypothetical protein
MTLPDELGSIKVGSEWCWEPLKLESRCYIRVSMVERKLDGNWWVLCTALTDGGGVKRGQSNWNQLSRFVEASVLIKPGS